MRLVTRPAWLRRIRWRFLPVALVVLAGLVTAVFVISGRYRGDPGERVVSDVYTTGYTWFDNTPAGSGRISHPMVHSRAGGTGTFDDPVTMAVGHSLASGHDVLDFSAGTRFYLPHVRRYFVVEDSCGDGATPQSHGCHNVSTAPAGARRWVDLYVGGGVDDDKAAVQRCAGRVTDGDRALHIMVADPDPGYLVVKGPLFQHGECTMLYPDTPLPAAR
jgi:hypothetical protein